jgi:curved DNA-binding protein CbpA
MRMEYDPQKDFYAILNSRPTDSDENLRRKFRELVHKTHPDKVKENDFEYGLRNEFVKVLLEAKMILNPENREKYNRLREQHFELKGMPDPLLNKDENGQNNKSYVPLNKQEPFDLISRIHLTTSGATYFETENGDVVRCPRFGSIFDYKDKIKNIDDTTEWDFNGSIVRLKELKGFNPLFNIDYNDENINPYELINNSTPGSIFSQYIGILKNDGNLRMDKSDNINLGSNIISGLLTSTQIQGVYFVKENTLEILVHSPSERLESVGEYENAIDYFKNQVTLDDIIKKAKNTDYQPQSLSLDIIYSD